MTAFSARQAGKRHLPIECVDAKPRIIGNNVAASVTLGYKHGFLKGYNITLAADAPREQIEKAALEAEGAAKWLDGKTIRNYQFMDTFEILGRRLGVVHDHRVALVVQRSTAKQYVRS